MIVLASVNSEGASRTDLPGSLLFRPSASRCAGEESTATGARKEGAGHAAGCQELPLSSEGASSCAAEQSDDQKNYHRSDERDQHRGQDRMSGDDDAPMENAGQKAAHQGADDARDHVTQESQAMAQGEMAGEESSNRADQDPQQNRVEVESHICFRPPLLLKRMLTNHYRACV